MGISAIIALFGCAAALGVGIGVGRGRGAVAGALAGLLVLGLSAAGWFALVSFASTM
jgi:hypothetical protein